MQQNMSPDGFTSISLRKWESCSLKHFLILLWQPVLEDKIKKEAGSYFVYVFKMKAEEVKKRTFLVLADGRRWLWDN